MAVQGIQPVNQGAQIQTINPLFVRTVPPVVKVSRTATLTLQGDKLAVAHRATGIPAHAIAFAGATGNLDVAVDHVLGPNRVAKKEAPKTENKGIKGFFAKLLG